jgi:poly-gamma-glutamate synthesis protein (capsule biosynthesis protein)
VFLGVSVFSVLLNLQMKVITCGDVMTGRGIDQLFHKSSNPEIHETFVKDARNYLTLCQNCTIKPNSQSSNYVWEKFSLNQQKKENKVNLVIGNLETSITESNDFWPGKGIHYRMHPLNTEILQKGGFDVFSLANNHVLDFGRKGLTDTITNLRKSNIGLVGAGENLDQAQSPFIKGCRATGSVTLVFGICHISAGVPKDWAATKSTSGVWLIQNSNEVIKIIKIYQNLLKQNKDKKFSWVKNVYVVVLAHWLGNWVDPKIDPDFPLIQKWSHDLVSECGVSLIHGTSTHHPLPVEFYKGSLIIYGSGDFINDYEGIEKEKKGESGCSFISETPLENPKRTKFQYIQMKNFQVVSCVNFSQK